MQNSALDRTSSKDQILSRLCKALSDGMDRFEARAREDRYTNYASIIEKHRDAVNEAMHGKDASEIRDRRAEGGRKRK